MANPTADERAAFEAWARKEGYGVDRKPAPYTGSDNKQGDYVELLTQTAWEGWEARSERNG